MKTKDHYPDNGCHQAKKAGYMGSCVACPFRECLEIDPSVIFSGKAKRNAEIRRLRQDGATISVLSLQFNLSQRQIQRITEASRKKEY